jgi:hypothetical protein
MYMEFIIGLIGSITNIEWVVIIIGIIIWISLGIMEQKQKENMEALEKTDMLLKKEKTGGEIKMNQWWGYVHNEGTLHVKRYFDLEDIIEAQGSPFVLVVAGPWECNDREEALERLKSSVGDSF